MTERVQVRIQGQSFTVKSETEDYVREVEAHVEQVMDEFQGGQRALSSHKLAVLAAFKIADNYFQLKKEIEGKDKETKDRMAGLISASDRLIEEITGPGAG